MSCWRYSGFRAAMVAALVLALAGPAPAEAQSGKPKISKISKSKKQKKDEDDCMSFFWTWPTRKRAYVGIVALQLTEELRSHFGAPTGVGMLVGRVDPESPAAHAGVKVGDVLTAVNGQTVRSSWDVIEQVRDRKKGDKVRLRLIRDRKPLSIQATLALRETPQVEVGRFLKKGWPGGGARGFIRSDHRCFDKVMERLRRQMQRQMQNLGQTKQIRRFLDRESELERRLREMERKLRKLERKTKR